MITQEQHRAIDADMAVRLVHWLMDTPDIGKRLAREMQKKQREKQIADAYAKGVGAKKIEKQFQTSHKTIKKACLKHGVPMRRNEWRFTV